MKINPVHAMITLLTQQTLLLRGDRNHAKNVELLSELLAEAKGNRQVLASLEKILRERSVVPDPIDESSIHLSGNESSPDILAKWKVTSKTADEINRQSTMSSGRIWESETPHFSGAENMDAQDGLNFQSSPEPRPEALSFAEPFRPSPEDIEKALLYLMPQRDLTSGYSSFLGSEDYKSELRETKYRFLLVALGLAMLLAILASVL